MGFFQNTRKPQGMGGRIMLKSMNIGHAGVADWGIGLGLTGAHLPHDARILDVGCSGGRNLSRWLDICPDGFACGVDYAQASVDESSRRNRRAIERGQCEVIKGDVAHLPLPDHDFDVVSAFETIYFWPDLTACCAEIRRVLRDGGTFLICNESDGDNRADERWCDIIGGMRIYSADEISCALHDAGFTDIEAHRDARRHWLCVTASRPARGANSTGDGADSARSALPHHAGRFR